MINVLAWLLAGGVLGGLAGRLMRIKSQQGVILNIAVGVLGAAIGGWFISPMLGVGAFDLQAFNMGALVASLVGALVLLAILNLAHRSTAG